ncbi:transposase, partial [bacterium]|nr:transposase [bacterium]
KARPCSEARAVAAFFVINTPGMSLSELGKLLNRDSATLGRSARRIIASLEHDETLTDTMNRLEVLLTKQTEKQA